MVPDFDMALLRRLRLWAATWWGPFARLRAHDLRRRLFRVDALLGRNRGGALGLAATSAAPLVPQAEYALRQEQRDGDEQSAQREQPEFRQRAGEPAFSGVDQQRTDDRTDDRAAPADRRPHDHFDRIGRVELAGI